MDDKDVEEECVSCYSVVTGKKENTASCSDRPDDSRVRGDIAYPALMSGIALADAALGIVHGFALSVGGVVDIIAWCSTSHHHRCRRAPHLCGHLAARRE